MCSSAPRAVVSWSRPPTAASAICWIVGKANRSLSWYGGVMVKDLGEHFDVDAQRVGARAPTLLRALGLAYEDYAYGETHLHSTAYLTSARRRAIIEERDRVASIE